MELHSRSLGGSAPVAAGPSGWGGPAAAPHCPSQGNPLRGCRAQSHVPVPQGMAEGAVPCSLLQGLQGAAWGSGTCPTCARVGTNDANPPSLSPGLAVPKPLVLPAHSPCVPPCLFQPAVTKRCPQLQQLRRAPGGPWGHVPLAGLLSSRLPPSAPDQAC